MVDKDDKKKIKGTTDFKLRFVPIDLQDFGVDSIDELVQLISKHLDEIFSVTAPPDAYWKMFADHYDLDDLGDVASGFSKFCFYSGMSAMLNIIYNLSDLEDEKTQDLACRLIKQMVEQMVRKYRPKTADKTTPSS